MRIVHFSDIHLTKMTGDWTALLDKRILGLANYLLRRRRHQNLGLLARALEHIPSLQPDVVICTGDISSIGSPEEFTAVVAMLQPLATNNAFTFIYVPGNHDCYVKRASCQNQLSWAFGQLNSVVAKLSALPTCWQLGNVKFLLVNECRPTLPIKSSGTLDCATQDFLVNHFEGTRVADEVRVLVNHFPCRKGDGSDLEWRRRLVGAECIQQALTSGKLDVALCGHIHTPFIRRENSGSLEICAGSLTMGGEIAVIDIDDASGQISHHWDADWKNDPAQEAG